MFSREYDIDEIQYYIEEQMNISSALLFFARNRLCLSEIIIISEGMTSYKQKKNNGI